MHFIVFDFSWDDRYTQEKLETMVMQIFFVSFWGGAVKQGALWSVREWWIALNDFAGEGFNHLITKNNARQKCWQIRAPH